MKNKGYLFVDYSVDGGKRCDFSLTTTYFLPMRQGSGFLGGCFKNFKNAEIVAKFICKKTGIKYCKRKDAIYEKH